MFGYKQTPGLRGIQERHGDHVNKAYHFLHNRMLTACHKLLGDKIAVFCRRVSLLGLAD